MATKRPVKKRVDPLQEAADPSTDSERLGELFRHNTWEVARAAILNPSLPEDVWREAFLGECPEAWANPMASFYLLAWIPRDDDSFTLDGVARLTAYTLWKAPGRCSVEGKTLLNAKLQEWWATSKKATGMMSFLKEWGVSKNIGSPEHREVVRVLIQCVRTAPNLTDEDRQALDLLEAWTAGGEDRRKEAKTLASSMAPKDAVRFSLDPPQHSGKTIHEVLWIVERGAGRSARTEHERMLADLIRQAMPLPPVVD